MAGRFELMNDVAALNDRSAVVNILPYQLRALRRRRQAALAVFGLTTPSPAPAADLRDPEQMSIRAGIRHIASGRMTVTHARLNTVMTMLTERTAHRLGLLEDPRLEAIVVDGQRQVFAGFWPE